MSKADIVLIRVREFLRETIRDAEPIVNGDEVLTDGEEKVYEGRYEVADTLRELTHQWENDDGTNK